MKKHDNVKLIVVPDVHGRTFWEDVFKYDTEIVFLGDYWIRIFTRIFSPGMLWTISRIY